MTVDHLFNMATPGFILSPGISINPPSCLFDSRQHTTHILWLASEGLLVYVFTAYGQQCLAFTVLDLSASKQAAWHGVPGIRIWSFGTVSVVCDCVLLSVFLIASDLLSLFF